MKLKKLVFTAIYILITCIFGINSESQELQHETGAINIEVPVRVFKGDTFVDDLTIDDFEIYEDGVLQKIEAIYLIKKTQIQQKQERKIFQPQTNRLFILGFFLTEYLPRTSQAIDYFFDVVFQPNDSFIVLTPIKIYNLKTNSFIHIPQDSVKDQLKQIIRKDTILGNSEYWSVIRDLETAVLENDADGYKNANDRLKQLRYIDQKRILDFSVFLKQQAGQKTIFFFYQQESVPYANMSDGTQASRPVMAELMGILPGIEMGFQDSFYRDDIFNSDLIKQAYSDSSISFHFMYITKPLEARLDVTRMQRTSSLRFEERSNDVFDAFLKLSKTTGGISDSSGNIASSFQRAAEASENYYLLYYSPKNYKADGKFRNIKVKIKGKNYRVMHRAGYIAD